MRGSRGLALFLCGDVMTGRGIDQIFPDSCPPEIYESYVQDAREYVRIAELANGPIPRRVGPEYIWGDSLAELERSGPDARIINLETSITLSEQWLEKGINYRMHPNNIACLSAARIHCCVLSNNHVLDWGYPGLIETLDILAKAQIRVAGAGRNRSDAEAPALLPIPGKGRVLVFGFGMESSGVPPEWAGTDKSGGVSFLEDLSDRTVQRIAARVRQFKRPGDVVVASIHWGPNWGYRISEQERAFAHGLIEEARVDVVHGHSSHHPKGIEVHLGKLVLYGCGDFIDDYEGISGYEEYRSDLGLMYLPQISQENGRLIRLEMVPTQMRRFQSKRASAEDARWLAEVLNREGKRFGTGVELGDEGRLRLCFS